jgi:hypothetical protein
MKRIFVIIVLSVVSILSSTGAAQESHPPDDNARQRPDENAALRYWMAFAQMNDSPISTEDAAQMDAIVSGKAPWDEQKFGPLVEQNKDAIETMIRGTQLPYCEWGLEYKLGPDAPIAHLPKARALARLNRLYAERLASSGDYDGSVRATIAGIHFAQHLTNNASFFGALTAKVALVIQLDQAGQLASSGRLSSAQLAALRAVVQSLPEGGFRWQNAAFTEGWAIRRSMTILSEAADPKALYQAWFGNSAPEGFRAPSYKDKDDLDFVMGKLYAKLLGMPPDVASAQLPALQKQIAALNPVIQMAIPNPARMIAARAEVIKAQREAEGALGMR